MFILFVLKIWRLNLESHLVLLWAHSFHVLMMFVFADEDLKSFWEFNLRHLILLFYFNLNQTPHCRVHNADTGF